MSKVADLVASLSPLERGVLANALTIGSQHVELAVQALDAPDLVEDAAQLLDALSRAVWALERARDIVRQHV
jgi:hypothetical protein